MELKKHFELVLGALLVAVIAPAANAANAVFALPSGGVYSQSSGVLSFANSNFTLQLVGYTCGPVSLCDSGDAENDALGMLSGSGAGTADNVNSGVATGASAGSSTCDSTAGYYSASAPGAGCEALLSSTTVNSGMSGATSLPEPATCILLGSALIGLSLAKRKSPSASSAPSPKK